MNQDITGRNDAEDGMIRNASSLIQAVRNYYRWNLSVFQIEKGKRILDIGCGPALYSQAVQELAPALYCATDCSEVFLNEARVRLLDVPNSHVEFLDIMSETIPAVITKERFDVVLCFDVLEHLSDDVLVLAKIRKIMEATGAVRIMVRVPALSCLYGKADKAIGHYRRYSRETLQRAMEQGGFTVEKVRYQNIAGIIPWFIIGQLRRRKLAVAPSEGRLFDLCVPIFKGIESFFPPPVGLSVYCIGSLRKAAQVALRKVSPA
ncbi:MAG: class I SAM-dependent methyltransferase [Syntrophales bacterium]